MSSKKVVVATYSPQSVFKIPKNIDLEDESIVKDWGVKWDILYITLVKDDEELRIEPHYYANEQIDLKYATDTTIEDAEQWFGEEEEEEEELPKLNIKTGFPKQTHELICRVCGLPDYAESCGEWDEDGNLTGVICGECDEEQNE